MKRWLGGVVVCCIVVFVVVGTGVAQMDAGPYHILHKKGAIYNSDTGWNWSSPPYYASASDWAVDFLYHSEGMSILHRDGAIWNENTGWDYTAYYSGTAYAKALEYLRDLKGCWGMEWMQWETALDQDEVNYDMEKHWLSYPLIYVQITQQTGTRFYGQAVVYSSGGLYGIECQYHPLEGTVIGDHVTIFVGEYGHCVPLDGPEYDTERYKLTFVGLIFWDEEDGEWEIKGSFVGSDLPEYGMDLDCTEQGRWGVFNAWPADTCECPPVME